MNMLDRIPKALLSVTDNVGHYKTLQQTDQYIVWAEDGEARAVWSDDEMSEQIITGTVDYFTRMEDDPNFEKIQNALNTTGAFWKLNSIQFENDTGYIHYEWMWEYG